MRGSSCKVVAAVDGGWSSACPRPTHSRQIPACQRLEAQLATLNQGNADPARADQIRRTEDMVNRQQLEVDRLVAQSRRIGCQSSGFFSIFSNPPPQCGALNRQIDQQRLGLERMRNQLEQLNGRHHRARRTTASAAHRPRQQRMWSAIPFGGNCRAAGRFLRSAVRRKQQRRHFLQPARTDGRDIPHGLRADLRRILFSDFLFDLARPFPRR